MSTSVFFGTSTCGARGAVKAGRRRVFRGRRAPLSSCSSEIEFGRVRPTSLLHSAVHSLIPCGDEGGRGGISAVEERRETDGERRRGRRDGGWREGGMFTVQKSVFKVKHHDLKILKQLE